MRNPKGDIFIATRVLGIAFELLNLPVFELLEEPLVLAPELPDVSYLEQLHRPTLKTETEGPGAFLGGVSVCVFHYLIS